MGLALSWGFFFLLGLTPLFFKLRREGRKVGAYVPCFVLIASRQARKEVKQRNASKAYKFQDA